ncbi:NUDIX domain-containing protein [Umezawaea tangerina]|uniref:ADP-ribose pyrophosphatase YjhB (NUDIX family) n=1 Tax=Umezawaea tangerina TaxID=84725 RepID=A0A2T0TGT1_9PSEU|nr:NUDIX hydrolase [Umezawaea tangerina]PRY44833.1 ADP-ribose pyrophosphatase YjhB (NUDIX family) [Umezawaea tangerina]
MTLEQYVAGLNRKRVVAGVLFRDATGRVLLVEPSYKPDWEIPGGAGEEGEPPWVTATREVREEMDLVWTTGALLVVDHVPARQGWDEGVAFVFDGGLLTEADVAALSFPDGEIVSARLCDDTEVRSLVRPLLADRIAAALHAVDAGAPSLCEQGRRVG